MQSHQEIRSRPGGRGARGRPLPGGRLASRLTVIADPRALAGVLTIARSAASIAYGKTVTLSGTLACGGQPLVGAPVVLRQTYDGGGPRILTTTHTDGQGRWSFRTRPAYNGTISAQSQGLTAKTAVKVAENYDHVTLTQRDGRVTVSARLHPGFKPEPRTRLQVTVTATDAVGILSKRLIRTHRRINHGYVPISATFGLPPGRWSRVLSVRACPPVLPPAPPPARGGSADGDP